MRVLIVLSPWHSHCKSFPGLFDKCSTSAGWLRKSILASATDPPISIHRRHLLWFLSWKRVCSSCRWWNRVAGCIWTAVKPTAHQASLSSQSTGVTRDLRSSRSGRLTSRWTSFCPTLYLSRSRDGRFLHGPSPGRFANSSALWQLVVP